MSSQRSLIEDDIDILLDEVETKYCSDCRQLLTSKQSRSSPFSSEDSLSNVINDICSIPDPFVNKENEQQIQTSVGGCTSKKCYTPYLGGTSLCPGKSTRALQKACDSLHCTSCDFSVCIFDGFAWHSDTDYYFLRDNVPDFHKLRPRLSTQHGSRAYACQCRYCSITASVSVQEEGLPWICGSH